MPFDETRSPSANRAELHRMVMPGHLCPFGLKSKALLERKGYEVDDHPLTSREEAASGSAAIPTSAPISATRCPTRTRPPTARS